MRSLADGRVEMEAQGGVSQLRKLLVQLKCQPRIHTQHMEIEKLPRTPWKRGFRVRGS